MFGLEIDWNKTFFEVYAGAIQTTNTQTEVVFFIVYMDSAP